MKLPARPRFRWGIASFLTAGTVAIITLLLAMTTVLDARRERKILLEDVERRAPVMASLLDGRLSGPLYFTDIDKLREITASLMSENEFTYLQIFTPTASW